MSTRYAVDMPSSKLRWRQLAWLWSVFWLLMLVVGIQEYFSLGGRRLWEPFVNYGSAMLAATVLAVIQIRRARHLDDLLGDPVRWFARACARMPVQLILYILTMYGLRLGIYDWVGVVYRHRPWLNVFAYEATKFTLFYVLFVSIYFGVRSYAAWVAERLRTEQQANLARQAQLAQLTQQLQPHFLFNALNTISSLIHSEPDGADLLLTRLATLLRAATDAARRPRHPFADELALLRAYADIMERRFADRVRIDWEVDPKAQACLVPTFALQPLLENCFRHGVEQRDRLTHIAIRAYCGTGRLSIEIEDDGDTRQLPITRGVGLGNVEDRLASLYGAQASLQLSLRSGGGLIVRVELPCVH